MVAAPSILSLAVEGCKMKSPAVNSTLALVLLVVGWHYALEFERFSRGVEADLYPSWYAAQQVFIEHRSPYSDEAARAIQRGIYGRTVAEGRTPMRDEQRFVYPLFGLFVMAPLALLSFAAAQNAAFWVFIVLTLAGTLFWTRVMGLRCTPALVAAVLAAFPITSGIVVRQPTVVYLFLLALAAWAAKSGRYGLAGLAAAFAMAKPQLAIAVLIPMLFWAITEWPHRRRIIYAFVLGVTLLAGSAFLLQPGWFPEWLSTVRAYETYANSTSPLGPAAALVAAAGVLLLWRERRELDFALALSAAGVYCLIPFQAYNEALLLPSALWIWRERKQLLERRFSRIAYQFAALLFLAAMAAMLLVLILPPQPALFTTPWRLFIVLGVLPAAVLVLHRYVSCQIEAFRRNQPPNSTQRGGSGHDCSATPAGVADGRAR